MPMSDENWSALDGQRRTMTFVAIHQQVCLPTNGRILAEMSRRFGIEALLRGLRKLAGRY